MADTYNRTIPQASPKAITKKFLAGSLLTLLITLQISCTTSSFPHTPHSTQRVIHHAVKKDFSYHTYKTSTFRLSTFERYTSNNTGVVHVYIEGDGNSWKTRYVLSDDPTPKQPLALALAMEDPHPHVVYLARPCQYTPHSLDTYCDAKYWSSHRYAPEVIASSSEVLDKIKQKSNAATFVLIGFSGGASVATLLAANREDVMRLITVAGDLNHDALNHYHRTSPMHGSLNPSHVVHQVKDINQQHWSGSHDPIVPSWISEDFVNKVGNPNCAVAYQLKGATHHRRWRANWSTILHTQPNTC